MMPLVAKVLRSPYGRGDANVRLLFVAIAEEHGGPRQKDPKGWVRLGIRELAERVGCDHATIPDVIDRAEDAGLKIDWPGPKSRIGYMLPADLYPAGEQVQGRARPRRTTRPSGGTVAPDSAPSPALPSGGTTPPDLVAPRHHDPSLTPSTPGEQSQRRSTADTTIERQGPSIPTTTSPVAAIASRTAKDQPQAAARDTTAASVTTHPPRQLPRGTTPPMPYALARDARPVAAGAPPRAPSGSTPDLNKQAAKQSPLLVVHDGAADPEPCDDCPEEATG